MVRGAALGLLGLALSAAPVAAASISCTIRYDLAGWSAFYKTASGSGTITCDNGQTAAVKITTKGGGLTVGRSKVTDGRGKFSPVTAIDDLFGDYGVAEAHAGAGTSKSAQVMTKGTVSLELTGTGSGVDLGFSFGRFTIERG
ncbi:MAG: hypothetical protein SF182_25655 [Deltaproteobacteria bacterium]|nr:hypothetical protein [Deltaproteobacteria bacterium]